MLPLFFELTERLDLKLGQYTKLPPRATFAAQMAGSIIGSIFNYTSRCLLEPAYFISLINVLTVMITIVDNNRAVLLDPVGTRVVSVDRLILLVI